MVPDWKAVEKEGYVDGMIWKTENFVQDRRRRVNINLILDDNPYTADGY